MHEKTSSSHFMRLHLQIAFSQIGVLSELTGRNAAPLDVILVGCCKLRDEGTIQKAPSAYFGRSDSAIPSEHAQGLVYLHYLLEFLHTSLDVGLHACMNRPAVGSTVTARGLRNPLDRCSPRSGNISSRWHHFATCHTERVHDKWIGTIQAERRSRTLHRLSGSKEYRRIGV